MACGGPLEAFVRFHAKDASGYAYRSFTAKQLASAARPYKNFADTAGRTKLLTAAEVAVQSAEREATPRAIKKARDLLKEARASKASHALVTRLEERLSKLLQRSDAREHLKVSHQIAAADLGSVRTPSSNGTTSIEHADPSEPYDHEVLLVEGEPLDPDQLTPNTCYRLNGIRWLTDENGNVSHVEGELKLLPGRRHKNQQTKTGHRGRGSDDDGGHIIASRFGGFGSGPNLIPQARGLNRAWGAWYKMEDTWAEHLRAGRRVSVSIDLAGDEFRPNFILVQYSVDGSLEERDFQNEDIAC